MDLESLRIFRAVASELSITHAAARLGRVQSNVSTRVQQLETELGADLFVRTGKRMALSAAGERFLDYAQRMLALGEEARHVVTGGRDGGTLRIGSMESTAASRLVPLLSAYHAGHPETRVEVSTGPSRLLLEQVRTGRLDCAFAALPPSFGDNAILKELGLAAVRVWREDLRLLLPATESGTRRAADVRTRSLAAFPQGCAYRSIAEDLLGVAGSPEWKVQEMASYHAMIACVAAGGCVTLLPASVLALGNVPAAMKALPAGRADTLLVWREDYDVPAFRHLRDELSEAGR
ncbi:LysR family transcriptional regulator [Pandoraea sp. XJJ-1]|uniref:HTH-type transcriptional regulator GltR n=1 Tax=Variovorax paradoxus TaxID=34073 RepID=A0A0H2MMW3_VARPD|nr:MULTISPECIES: LysR family transcriptional regulator [Pseudomonadota]KLN58070.1 HTH-type transcriptional regulator GltR [Variovorax paradoxus]MBL0607653.1 LysR family transcriptional regulator [Aeromonas caviae]WAL82154.1 LysR family transcriptional regulator [Pandoraea sp. XJJ-1]HCI1918306.1 LysR family transcriptional regulator [Pseudomonas aeruginosa]